MTLRFAKKWSNGSEPILALKFRLKFHLLDPMDRKNEVNDVELVTGQMLEAIIVALLHGVADVAQLGDHLLK